MNVLEEKKNNISTTRNKKSSTNWCCFFYSYFLKLGILDGVPGFIWNVLQVFWYRYLVDVKVYEFEFKHNFNQDLLKEELIKLNGKFL